MSLFLATSYPSSSSELGAKIAYDLPNVDELSRTPRGQEILKCAGCHQEVFKNWLQGPHAFSFKAIEYVFRTAETKEYLQYMEKNQEKVCLKCHTPTNIFEGIYKGADQAESLDDFFKGKSVFKHNPARKEGRETGVDCISCHVQEGKVITREDFVPNPNIKRTKEHCNPVPSKTYSSKYNCLACHEESMQEMSSHANKKIFSDVRNCLQCHQEYDKNGKGTHYFFWNKDDGSGRRPELLGGLLKGLLVEVVNENGNNFLNVQLQNTVFPHKLYVCPEVVIELHVIGEDEKAAFSTYIRLNRKKHQDNVTTKEFYPNRSIPGEYGYDFDPGGPPLVKKYQIKEKIGHKGYIDIIIKKKTHYWGLDSDALFVQKVRRNFTLLGKEK